MLALLFVVAVLSGDQTTLLVCTLISAVVGPVLVVVVGHKVTTKVEAVHHEVRPPSNGTTTGAYAETNQAWWAWVYEELRAITLHIGIDVHAPPPKLPLVDPPQRPSERRRSDIPTQTGEEP